MKLKPNAFVHLLARSLQPSATSLLVSLIAGIVIVVAHVISASIAYGTIAPGWSDGEFGLLYTNDVVGPLTRLLNSTLYERSLLFVVWSVVGLAAYEVCAMAVRAWQDWRDPDREVSFSVDARELRHRMRETLLLRLVWRLGVSLVALYGLLLARPLIRSALAADDAVVHGKLSPQNAWHEAAAIFVWAALVQLLVIFARLYVFRTRLFGDEATYE